jgi:TRAP-type transport system periplasmic protein
MKNGIARCALAIGLIAMAPAMARAQAPVTLKFGFYPPIRSYVNTEGMTPWIHEVEQASNGTLKIQLFAGPTLGTERNMYERTLAGVAQIAYSTFGPLASLFPRVQVADLPFVSHDARVSSMALWHLYAKGVFGHEFDKVKLLAIFNFPSAVLNTNAPVKTLEDIKGMKLAVSSRTSAEVVAALGASPVTLTPPETYQGLSRGVAEGSVISWTAVKTFKLDEVTKYHVTAPLGEAPAFVFMNKAAYAALPAQAKQAIDKYSGESFSEKLGANNQAAAEGEAKKVATRPGHTVTELSPAEYAKWEARIRSVDEAWVKQAPDGAKVLAAYREEIAKLAAAAKN